MKARSAVLAAWLLTACGGGAAAPSPKTTPGSPGRGTIEPERSGGAGDTTTVDAAPGQFGGEAPSGGSEQPGYGQPATPTGPFAEEPPLTLEEAISALDSAASELSNAGRDCATGCKALGSMQRSSDRICELNGPADPGSRCQKARDRVETARETLRKRCGSCEP